MKREVEDWLTELPPLDGDDDDVAVDVDTADDIDPAAEHDSLDDGAAENLDLEGDGIEEDDGEHEDEADAQWSADVGEPELDLPADDAGDDDDPPPDVHGAATGNDDLDEELDDPTSTDDGGEDGTNEPVEQSLDQELPALDADEEGDFEDALVADALVAFSDSNPDVGAEGGDDARSVPRRADVMWSEQTGSSRPLSWGDDEDPCVDIASRGASAIVAVSANGNVWAAAGERMRRTLLAEIQEATGVALERPLIVAMAPHADAVWLVDRAGRALRSADGGFTWLPHGFANAPPIAAVARESALSVLLRDGAGARLLTSEDGQSWFDEQVSVQLQTPREGDRYWVALAGAAVAVGDGGGVWLARDGLRFIRVAHSRGATAGAFTGTRADASLVFARPAYDGEGGTHLVRVDDLGALEVVAQLGPREALGDDADEVFPLHLHWDEALRTMLVAYTSAVVACQAPRASSHASRR